MKKPWSYLLISALVILGFSCNKEEEPCEAIIENSGIIVSSISVNSCDEPFYDKAFLITNNVELDAVLATNNNCAKPEIDFSEYALLGMYAFTANTGSYYREVVKDTANNQYIYTVKVTNCGNCNCLSENMNWVTVPKLPEEWSVKFVRDLPKK